MLFRAIYEVEGKVRGMTIEKVNAAMAAEFAYTILQDYIKSIGGGEVLTVIPVKSRQDERLTSRQRRG